MAVNYVTALKNNRLDEVTALLDVSAPGELVITITGNGGDLATLPLLNPSFPAASSGVLTAAGSITVASAEGTGAAAEAEMNDGASAAVITGLTVAAGSGDIDMDSTSITTGQTVTVNTMTITHAA